MPASSKQQQKFMGMVHALKKGDIKPSDVSQSVKDAAKSMSKKDAKDFASTKHKNLPRKVKQEILNKLKEYSNKMGRDHLGGDDYTSSKKGGLRDFDGYDNVDYNKDMPMDEAKIPQPIQNLINDMIKNKIQRRSVRIKNKSGLARFMKDVKPAVKDKLLSIKHNPIDKDELFISLGPKAQKIKESVSPQALQKLNLGLKKINRKFKGASLDGKTIDIELHPGHNRDSEIYQIYDLLKKLKLDKHKTSIFNESVNEVTRGQIHKAVKKGNFPITIVVIKNGKVIHQELVKTPEAVPASYKVIEKKYKGATISIEDKTGKRLMEGPIDRVVGGRPYKYVGDGRRGKVTVSGPMKDRERKDILKRAKKAGYSAAPGIKGGVVIHVESVNERMDKRQAGELIKQLGGNRFIAMTGAKNFVVGPKGAGFKIGRNSKGINYVRIDLDGRDLYNMEFIQVRGGNMKVKSKEKGVYFDQLRKLFTKNTGMYTTLGEGMFSTIDQIRQDSKDVRDFVKNVFKDRDFAKMKNDKEFIKYLKSIYEGTNESKGVPANYMQGRTSDYHTALRGKNRDYSGGTNFKKKHHGQPDIENEDEDQETNHLSNKQTHVKSDKLKVSEEMGNLSSSERIELYKLYSKAMKAMPGSPNQKKIKVLINKLRKKANLKPLPEYGQRLDLSFIEDEEARLKGTPKPKDAIDRDIDESILNELGIFPVQNYVDGIIPASFIDTTTRDKKERLKSTLRDLKNTLNHFWKQHKIPYRIR